MATVQKIYLFFIFDRLVAEPAKFYVPVFSGSSAPASPRRTPAGLPETQPRGRKSP